MIDCIEIIVILVTRGEKRNGEAHGINANIYSHHDILTEITTFYTSSPARSLFTLKGPVSK